MNVSMLSGGVSLHRDDEKIDHFVIIPSNDDGSIKSRVDIEQMIFDLASRGLELIQDDEIPWELTEAGWQAWVVTFDGSELLEVAAA